MVSDQKFDKASFALLIIAIILVLWGYGLYLQYNGHNHALADHLASILRYINPGSEKAKGFYNSSNLYLNEERAILMFFVSSIVLSLVAFFRVSVKQQINSNVANFAGLITLSITLIIGNIYMVITSGILGAI